MYFKFKCFLIDQLTRLKKHRWKKDGQVKVLIAVNSFFTPESWKQLFLNDEYNAFNKQDIIFCKTRTEIFKHFKSADICVLFGFGRYLESRQPKNKLIYFPLMGTDFLEKLSIDSSVRIQKPTVISTSAIAEYSYAMAILMTRNLHQSILNQASHKWVQEDVIKGFRSISDYKIGVMGLGNVGTAVAEYFAKNDCVVYGLSNTEKPDIHSVSKWYNNGELGSFLKAIDILIIALPLTEKTKNLIALDELELLGPSKYLINISRGGIIKERDLFFALKNKIIKGSVLDVFDNEPLSSKSPFYKLKNVIITPHISGNINLFVKDIQKDFIHKSLKYIENV